MKKKILAVLGAVIISAPLFSNIFAKDVHAVTYVNISSSTFPNATFREYVKKNFDTEDPKGVLDTNEIRKAKNVYIHDKSVDSLAGIKYLTSLEKLSCNSCALTSLDLTGNTNLLELDCSDNKITSLDVSGCTKLEVLICSKNELTSLPLTKNTKLQMILCDNNKITSLTCSDMDDLDMVQCNDNKLSTITLSNLPKLRDIYANRNPLTALTLSGDLSKLIKIDCEYSTLSSITGLENCDSLLYLSLSGTSLTDLDLTKNNKLIRVECDYCASLTNISFAPATDSLERLLLAETKISKIDIRNCGKLMDTVLNNDASSFSGVIGYNKDNIIFYFSDGQAPLYLTDKVKPSALTASGCTLTIPAMSFADGYEIYRDGTLIADTQSTSYTDTSVSTETSYKYTYRAYQTLLENNKTVKIYSAYSDALTVTIPSTPEPTAQISDFVRRIYLYVLDREPEAEGAAFWTSELYNFKRTGAEVAEGFIFSTEFIDRKTSNSEFVTILYKTFFGRDPETSGFNYWVGQLDSGSMSRERVAKGFIYSQEWADKCAEYGIRSGGDVKPSGSIEPTSLTYGFVERMYNKALGRDYDSEGRAYWAGELSNYNLTGEQLGVQFFLSEEMNNMSLSNDEFVKRLYLTFMDREGESDGSNYWVGRLNSGASRQEIVLGFTRSPEFVEKCITARILPF